MRRFSRFLRQAALAVLVIAGAVFLLNTNLLAPARDGKPVLIAHRGLGQGFSREGLTGETCTAKQMLPPEHPYLENTIPSFEAAFAAGADVVEFDVQPTADGHFVVFHDWTLDCRTDGKGVTREYALAELQRLDLGYGYTADGGKSFPFRGKGVGLMPTLEEVLDRFPDKRFMINIKSRDKAEGRQLAEAIGRRPAEDGKRLIVYGDRVPVDAFRARLPDIRVLAGDQVRTCFLRHAAIGWSGTMPEACRGSLFMLPVNFAPWIWGFPRRLLARAETADTLVVLLGAYDGSGFSSGIDDAETFARVSPGFDGAIWTNRIDRIGPLVKSSQRGTTAARLN